MDSITTVLHDEDAASLLLSMRPTTVPAVYCLVASDTAAILPHAVSPLAMCLDALGPLDLCRGVRNVHWLCIVNEALPAYQSECRKSTLKRDIVSRAIRDWIELGGRFAKRDCGQFRVICDPSERFCLARIYFSNQSSYSFPKNDSVHFQLPSETTESCVIQSLPQQTSDPSLLLASVTTVPSSTPTSPAIMLAAESFNIVKLLLKQSVTDEDMLSVRRSLTKIGHRTRLNFVESPVTLPPPSRSEARQIQGDRGLYEKCLLTGQPPAIDWSKVHINFRNNIGKLSGNNICKVTFLDVSPPAGCDRGATVFNEPQLRNLDTLMEEEGTSAVVIHDSYRVLVSTLSEHLCYKLRLSLAHELGVECVVGCNSCVLEGIDLVANLDTMQQSEEKAYTANFGCSVRSQGKTGSTMIQEAIGGERNTKIDTGTNPMGPSDLVQSTYFSDYFETFHQEWEIIDESDNWYGRRVNGKKSRKPRFSIHKKSFSSLVNLQCPYPLMTSIPLAAPNPRNLKNACVDTKWANHEKMLAAACWESTHRALSEFVLMRVFGKLPYANMGQIAVDNASRYFEANPHVSLKLPIRKCVRPLPKGACGIHLEKPLHDDGNGALTHGLWTCVTENEQHEIDFHFMGHYWSCKFKASKGRFALFHGWVPHKTVSKNKNKRKREGIRLHHTAFVKPEMEHICLNSFNSPTS